MAKWEAVLIEGRSHCDQSIAFRSHDCLFILKISGLIKLNSDKFIGINNPQLKLLNKSCDDWSSNLQKNGVWDSVTHTCTI